MHDAQMFDVSELGYLDWAGQKLQNANAIHHLFCLVSATLMSMI